MTPCQSVEHTRTGRRPRWFWLMVAVAAIFMSLEPSLFLVTLALALALWWILLLARLLIGDALAYATLHFSGTTGGDRSA